ncbi:hypothetical protein TwortDSMZ_049 [Staphylococcus phage Twort]|uniref:DUF3310 domain-containing protein n=2 Tax=Staphylococcus phage Twort (strain DSM 17442 / HER 48) TaxID=2908167 RepID=A0A6H0X562_BPTWO|nr:nucleotide kinase [Staphylococcus phage Twort]AAX92392.1 ORF098 [Staphylococcus phage Twort]QIW89055.1 hypothetical protein TwortDSMZ_049 [Staphylococcus phage Twort]
MESKEFILFHQNNGEDVDLLLIKQELVEACTNVSQHPRHFKKLEESVKDLLNEFEIEPKVETPKHYSDSSDNNVDVISFTEEQLNGFVDAMLFNIIKYTVRLGRKDNEEKEVNKIYNYYFRLKEHLVNEGFYE